MLQNPILPPRGRLLRLYTPEQIGLAAEALIDLLDELGGDADLEEDDPGEEDDPAGQCDEDGINVDTLPWAGYRRAYEGAGCEISECTESPHQHAFVADQRELEFVND